MEKLFLNLLQISLTCAVVIAVLLLFRRVLQRKYPARAMTLVWFVIAVRMLLPVQVTLGKPPVTLVTPSYRVMYSSGFHRTPKQAAHTTQVPEDAVTEPVSRPVPSVSLLTVLGAVWLIGALGMAALQAFWYVRFRMQVKRQAHAMDDPALLQIFERETAPIKAAGTTVLLIYPSADCPMLIGFVRSQLLLPEKRLPLCDAQLVFRHELTHRKHADLWMKAVLVLARCMHWFNPLVYVMVRCASEDMELACDWAIAKELSFAEKKQYGEIILRSVSTQSKRRQAALVSRFTGDKEHIMKRLQSIFDGKVKRRSGVLLLAVLFATAIVGGSFGIRQNAIAADDKAALAQQITQLANEWGTAMRHRNSKPMYEMMDQELAQAFYEDRVADGRPNLWNIGVSSPYVSGYTVQSVDAGKLQATLVYNWRVSGAPDTREAERLTFEWQDGALKVSEYGNSEVAGMQPLSSDVDSVAQFKLLYANDLGLPNPGFLYSGYVEDEDYSSLNFNRKDPFDAIIHELNLTGGQIIDSRNDYAEDNLLGKTVSYKFADGSILNIDMANVYDEAYIPVDWSLPDGSNTRTAADLARQYAFGIEQKSGQFIYPILSEAQQKAFIKQHQELANENGKWYWKVGGSSPSFAGWAVTDADEADTKHVVLLAYGGGAIDYRDSVNGGSGYVDDVTVGTEKHRAVITDTSHLDTRTLSGMKRFRLLFGQENLPLTLYDEDTLTAEPGALPVTMQAALKSPDTAALALFGVTETVSAQVEDGTGENGQKTVDCTFKDGSGTVKITMYPVGNTSFWLPSSWETVQENSEAAKTAAQMTQVAEQWAKAWLTRQGKARYDIMSVAMQQQFLKEQGTLEDGQTSWSIGVSSPWPERWAVSVDVPNQTAQIWYAEWDSTPMEYRRSEILHFCTEKDAPVVDSVQDLDVAEHEAVRNGATRGYWIDSLDDFLTLYNNSLNLPEYSDSRLTVLQGDPGRFGVNCDLRDPVQAMQGFFALQGGTATLVSRSEREADVTYRFSNGDVLNVLMVPYQKNISLPEIWRPYRWEAPAQGLSRYDGEMR